MAKKTNYHHGDLKNALLDAALALLEETGPDSLSLRAVANRVGVSHAAPEHHFPTRKHLLTALATVGFIRFEAAMRKGRQKSLSDDADQMRGAMHGYLEYAAGKPWSFPSDVYKFDAKLGQRGPEDGRQRQLPTTGGNQRSSRCPDGPVVTGRHPQDRNAGLVLCPWRCASLH